MARDDRIDPGSWQRAGEVMRWRGARMFYRCGGAGSALVLLHGFPTSGWDFHALWGELTSRHFVVAPDFVGFGFSDKPRDAGYSVANYANQVEGLLRELCVQDYHVLAHDLGDTVLQELLARAVERGAPAGAPTLRSAFLLNGGLFPETHRPRFVQTALASFAGFALARLMNRSLFGKSFAQIFGPDTAPSEQELDAYWQCIAHQNGQHLSHRLIGYMQERREFRERWVQPLIKPPVPLAYCVGMLDPVSGAHMVARLRELVNAPDVTELADIGHYPQVEAPQAVLDAYRRFRAGL